MPESARQPTSAGVGAVKTVGWGAGGTLVVSWLLPDIPPDIQPLVPVAVLAVVGFAGKTARNMAAEYGKVGKVPWWVKGLGFGL